MTFTKGSLFFDKNYTKNNKNHSAAKIYSVLSIAFIFLIFIFTSLSVSATLSDDIKGADRKNIIAFIDVVKNKNAKSIAQFIHFPLLMKAPLPHITNENAFIERFDEVFDDILFHLIANSDYENDWKRIGWRGITLQDDTAVIWLSDQGKIRSLIYETQIARKKRMALLSQSKAQLHSSVKEFSAPIVNLSTKDFFIRIDKLKGNQLRYAAWKKPSSISEQPEIVIGNGSVTFEGSGGNHYYQFTNDTYKYVCQIEVIGKADKAGLLLVYKGSQLILEQDIIRVQ